MRVRPDIPALDRTFDYRLADPDGDAPPPGTIVRVRLGARIVRGWVEAVDVPPEVPDERLAPLHRIVGAGPPGEVMALARWAARRWCGPVVTFLRAASPPRVVPLAAVGVPPTTAPAGGPAPGPVPGPVEVRLVAWPPTADRRELVASSLAPVGTTVVCSPEVVRLGALARHLRHQGREVVEYHGLLPERERARAWCRIRAGSVVVLGGRLAAWAPVPDLAAVVVLDEGDEALSDERAPTWDATDVLAERARRHGGTVTLVGALPTLRAVAAARGRVSRPPRPVERAGWPRTEVVDLRTTDPAEGLMTAPLAAALAGTLDAGRRAVCVLNRTGGARLLVCPRCGVVARCDRCGAGLAEEPAGAGGLRCRRCGHGRAAFCAACANPALRRRRPGARRVSELVAALVPGRRVTVVEGATGPEVPADVLVGTEAVLHRVPPGPGIGLVAHLDADVDLLAPRVYAPEQAARLLVRSARLTGPHGRLLVQTRVPEHPVIEAVRRRDPLAVAEAERPARAALGYPPFGAVAEVRGTPEAVAAALAVPAAASATVAGPVRHEGREVALVQAADAETLADVLAAAAAAARTHGGLRIAVDPKRI